MCHVCGGIKRTEDLCSRHIVWGLNVILRLSRRVQDESAGVMVLFLSEIGIMLMTSLKWSPRWLPLCSTWPDTLLILSFLSSPHHRPTLVSFAQISDREESFSTILKYAVLSHTFSCIGFSSFSDLEFTTPVEWGIKYVITLVDYVPRT